MRTALGHLVLLAANLAVGAVVLPIAATVSGQTGVAAAFVALLLCWLSGVLALTVGGFVGHQPHPFVELFVGMAFRTGIPLAGGLAIYLLQPALAIAGFLYYLLVFYLVNLAIQTWLSLPGGPRRPAAAKTPPDDPTSDGRKPG